MHNDIIKHNFQFIISIHAFDSLVNCIENHAIKNDSIQEWQGCYHTESSN